MTETATVETLPTVEQNAEGTGPATSSNGPARTPRAEKQHAIRVEASQRHNKLAHATIMLREKDRDARLVAGVTGREGYVAWTHALNEAIRDAINDTLVTLTLRRFKATKTTWRVVATGVVTVNGEAIRLRGEASVRDVADASTIDGATVTVRLARQETRKGDLTTRFVGTSEGLASTGTRIGVKVTLVAGRHERVAVSAL